MKGVPKFDVRPCGLSDVRHLLERFHVYKSVGRVATYVFAVFEFESPVAAFVWQPPPPGSALSVCASCPQGVLSLSRMVAVPKTERLLNHISKPLKHIMLRRIDRTRWPVLVTYSDESVGHTGHVYKCSGWQKTSRKKVATYVTETGSRISQYSNGITRTPMGSTRGSAYIQRWEHWIVDDPAAYFNTHWRKIPSGKTWASGSIAYTYVKRTAVAKDLTLVAK